MKKCHRIKNWWHCRKAPPGRFDKRSFRVKTISRNTKLVIGCPRGKWNNKSKRCRVGTRVQKVMKRA